MTLMTHQAESRSRDSGLSSGFMPTPDASPKQGFSNIVDSIDFGDEQRGLLDELDKLREYGVDKYVELPQIVVVGDQSSGKSSVLEAITELPFPRSSIRCTRFATQIKLRHSPENSLKVGIIPDPKRTGAERQRLAQFPSTFPPNTPFGDIMDLATKYIVPDNKASFCSKDIFSIEMSGPNKPHLTIVDLPGLIQAANNHQSQADVDSIRDLAYNYMQNQRTIILAIVSAASDMELQPVLARDARQFDPQGARTLGIITKPDKTETPEREAQFLELARNENIKFNLGWHVLRNRAPNEMNSTTEERRRTEQKFFSPPSNWSQLGADQLGIETLRTKLSRELIKHIIHEMPMVQQEIRGKLEEVRRQLDQLGERGSTPEEMRDELRDLFEKSQALTRSAMEGQYVDLYGPAFFHPSTPSPMEAIRKLRARIVIQNEHFAAEMSSLGHLVELSDETPGTPGAPAGGNSHHPRRMTRSEFIQRQVEPLLDASPGLELRMDKNPLLVYTLFRSYSQNWPDIAKRHFEEIQAICNDFLQEVVDFAFPVDMRPRAWVAFIEEKMEDRLQEAHKESAKLFRDRTRAAKPYDPEHTTKVMEWLANRNKTKPNAMLSEFAPDVFLQKMLVYYELTCKTFVSNVIVQVVERHLVDELDRIFNVTRIGDLDEATVLEIASEDDSLRQKRLELRNSRRILEAGERICRKYMARRDLRLEATPAAAKTPKVSSRPYIPNGGNTNTRKPIATPQPEPMPIRTSFDTASHKRQPSYQTEPLTPTIDRTPSRATIDTQASANISNVTDPYMPSNYTPSREAYTPSSYGRNDSTNGYYESAPNIPPRPPPSLPPKRPADPSAPQENGVINDGSSDHRRPRDGLRGMFAGSRK